MKKMLYALRRMLVGASLFIGLGLSLSATEGCVRDNSRYTVNTDGTTATYAVSDVDRAVFDVHKDTPAQSVSASAHAIDLGLSVRWCNMNVGAESPEQYGGYFAWGETEEKSEYTEDNCTTYEKNIGSDIGGTDYDVAHVRMGGEWRLPTNDEYEELIDDCTWTWTTENGVSGYKITGPNGNSIFLPAAGYRSGGGLYNAGSYGYCWSSSYYEEYTGNARILGFNSDGHGTYNSLRDYGRSVRAVCP